MQISISISLIRASFERIWTIIHLICSTDSHTMAQAKLNETISIFSFYYNKVQKKDAKKPKKRQIEEVQMAKKKVQKFGWLEGERRV